MCPVFHQVRDWDAMAAKIAEEGGSIVLPDELKNKLAKKAALDRPNEAGANAGKDTSRAKEMAKEGATQGQKEESPVEYDADGKVGGGALSHLSSS